MPDYSWGARASGRIYGWLLALYPKDFRARFGPAMADDFARMYSEHRRVHGVLGPARLWRRVLVDAASSVVSEHRDSRSVSGFRAEKSEGMGRGEGMGSLILDVRLAGRALIRRPGYSVVAVATLALAIGANTVLFSVLNGVLLRPLPYPDADRLALLSESDDAFFGSVSYPNVVDWRERMRSFDEIGAFSWTTASLTGGAEAVRVTTGRAEPSFMRAAGLEPLLGRGFLEEDNTLGAASVVILSHSVWQQNFGADPEILSRVVSINGVPAEVVGVLDAGADFADAGTALWIPLIPSIGNWTERREVHALTVLGRIAADVTPETARLELARMGESLALEHPEANTGRGGYMVSLHHALLGDVSTTVWLLMGMAGLVLLIGCANVASLLLVRLTARRGELDLRRALGAGQWGVTRLLLAESMTLTLTGGVLGVGLAHVTMGPVVSMLQGRLPRVELVTLDTTVLLFGLSLSLIIGVAFGLLPAWKRRGATRESAGGNAGRELGGGRRISLMSALSAAQVAGSVVLLVGAGLLMRSFNELQSTDPGFDPQNLVTLAVSLSSTERDTEEVIQFYQELTDALASTPGVTAAAAVNALPISGGDSNGDITIEGRPFELGEAPGASFRRITPNYFGTVGTPLLYGRDFDDSDGRDVMVTIINESMARSLWADPADAVGARIKVGPPDFEPWLTIVGVAGDVRNVGLESEPRFATYEPHAQRPWSTMSVVYRTEGDPSAVSQAVRERIRAAGGDIPVYDFGTLTDRISESLRPRQIAMLLTIAFALLALVTASIGVYGVLSYSVSQRAPELGVRMALGAGRDRVMRAVAVQAASMIVSGLLVGLLLAAALGVALQSALHGVGRFDVVTFVGVPVLLALVGALACFVPARRAARIDPAMSLRRE